MQRDERDVQGSDKPQSGRSSFRHVTATLLYDGWLRAAAAAFFGAATLTLVLAPSAFRVVLPLSFAAYVGFVIVRVARAGREL